ncbi:DUF2637 domain-containing protein [Micromonospora sp. NBRC 107095]|uniref:DUF2637 domain-containing protein n=1 Tax=Micromonospora sp. NBRC 107095 TaxID=3032209 RepID=UPI0024A267E5|nr:DUF2637 domain-containing protein [Micromonospora sp. NBRC 107095]GLZ62899.1 hypothetical protein Misp05_64750 [Micromonospora sp. NBRC 107095]
MIDVPDILDETDPAPSSPTDDGLRPAVRAMVAELAAHYKGADPGSIDKAVLALKPLSAAPESWGSRGMAAEAVKAYRATISGTPTMPPAPKPAVRTAAPKPARRTAPPANRPPAPSAADVVQPVVPEAVGQSPVPPSTAGLGWARFGFGLGVVASTAANIAHSFTPSAEVVRTVTERAALTGRTVDWSTWTPPIGTIISAAFWPIALVVSVEVISRVMWPAGWRWKVMRFGGVSLVAAVAAFISYKHLHGLIGSYGEDAWSAAVGPLAIDGLMIVCSAAMLAIGQHKRAGKEG